MSFELAVVLKTTAILCCASLVALALRRASASVRHAVWALSLGAVMVIPLISILLPTLDLPILPAAKPAETVLGVNPSPPEFSNPGVAGSEPFPAEAQATRPAVADNTAPSWGWHTWLAMVWGLGAFVMVLRWLAAVWDLRYLRGNSVPLLGGPWPQLVTDVKRELNITTKVEVRIGDDSVPPMTWGIFRRVLLLPASVVEWTSDRRRAVLAHELAHVKRRDGLVRVLTQTARVVYWFNPLVWYANYRLEIERERACDDCVLLLGTDAADYADHLVAIARGLNSGYSSAAVRMANPAQLKSRVVAILEADIRRRPVSLRALAMLLSIAGALTASIAVLHVTATPVGAPSQASGQSPKEFEFSYEEGYGNSYTEMVRAGSYDGYDSEKQTRFVDTVGGQTTYKAQLSNDERKAIYEALMQNGLLAIQTDFPNQDGSMIEPSRAGRLQVKIDGKVAGIRFSPDYGQLAEMDPQRFPPGTRENWARLRKVLDVINGILKTRDDKQKLRPHNGYY